MNGSSSKNYFASGSFDSSSSLQERDEMIEKLQERIKKLLKYKHQCTRLEGKVDEYLALINDIQAKSANVSHIIQQIADELSISDSNDYNSIISAMKMVVKNSELVVKLQDHLETPNIWNKILQYQSKIESFESFQGLITHIADLDEFNPSTVLSSLQSIKDENKNLKDTLNSYNQLLGIKSINEIDTVLNRLNQAQTQDNEINEKNQRYENFIDSIQNVLQLSTFNSSNNEEKILSIIRSLYEESQNLKIVKKQTKDELKTRNVENEQLQHANDKLKEKINRYKSHLQQTNDLSKSLLSASQLLHTDCEESSIIESIKNLKSENKNKKKEINILVQEKEKLENQLSTQQSKFEDIKQQLNLYSTQFDQIQVDAQNNLSIIKEQEDTIDQLKQNVLYLEGLNSQYNQSEERANELQEQLISYQNQEYILKNIENQNSELNEQIISLRNEINIKNEENQELNNEIIKYKDIGNQIMSILGKPEFGQSIVITLKDIQRQLNEKSDLLNQIASSVNTNESAIANKFIDMSEKIQILNSITEALETDENGALDTILKLQQAHESNVIQSSSFILTISKSLGFSTIESEETIKDTIDNMQNILSAISSTLNSNLHNVQNKVETLVEEHKDLLKFKEDVLKALLFDQLHEDPISTIERIKSQNDELRSLLYKEENLINEIKNSLLVSDGEEIKNSIQILQLNSNKASELGIKMNEILTALGINEESSILPTIRKLKQENEDLNRQISSEDKVLDNICKELKMNPSEIVGQFKSLQNQIQTIKSTLNLDTSSNFDDVLLKVKNNKKEIEKITEIMGTDKSIKDSVLELKQKYQKISNLVESDNPENSIKKLIKKQQETLHAMNNIIKSLELDQTTQISVIPNIISKLVQREQRGMQILEEIKNLLNIKKNSFIIPKVESIKEVMEILSINDISEAPKAIKKLLKSQKADDDSFKDKIMSLFGASNDQEAVSSIEHLLKFAKKIASTFETDEEDYIIQEIRSSQELLSEISKLLNVESNSMILESLSNILSVVSTNEDFQSNLKTILKIKAKKQDEVRAIEEEVKHLKQTMHKVRKEGETVDLVKDVLDKLTSENSELTEMVSRLTALLHAESIEDVEEKVTGMKQQLNSLKKLLNLPKNATYEEITNQIKNMKSGDSRKEISILKQRAKELEQINAETQKFIQSQEKKLNEQEEVINQQHHEMEALENEFQQIMDELGGVQSIERALEAIKDMRSQINDMHEELAEKHVSEALSVQLGKMNGNQVQLLNEIQQKIAEEKEMIKTLVNQVLESCDLDQKKHDRFINLLFNVENDTQTLLGLLEGRKDQNNSVTNNDEWRNPFANDPKSMRQQLVFSDVSLDSQLRSNESRQLNAKYQQQKVSQCATFFTTELQKTLL